MPKFTIENSAFTDRIYLVDEAVAEVINHSLADRLIRAANSDATMLTILGAATPTTLAALFVDLDDDTEPENFNETGRLMGMIMRQLNGLVGEAEAQKLVDAAHAR